MAWEWIESAGTVIVALAGIGATLLTSAQGRKHGERLAMEGHRRAHEDMLRRERLKVYASALAHAVDQERRLNNVWASDGERSYQLSPPPPGAPLELGSTDEITVQIRLLADEEVERAWTSFIDAREALAWWGAVAYSGDTEEEAPQELVEALREAILAIKGACRRSLQ